MAVKAFLDSLDGVPADLQSHYEEVEEGGKKHYRLSLDGGFLSREDVGPALRARDHEKAARLKAEAAAKERADALSKLQEEIDGIRAGAIPKSDFEALKKSLEERHGKEKADLAARLSTKDQAIHRYLVGNTARDLAAKLAGDNAPILLPHIEARLEVAEEDGQPTTRVRGLDGKPSVMTLDELEKEFKANKLYASIIVGSRASGGGANGANGGGTGTGGKDWSKVDPSKLSPLEKAQWARWKAEARKAG